MPLKPDLLILLSALLVGCTDRQRSDDGAQAASPDLSPNPIHVVFLTRDGCANTPELLANLESAAVFYDPPIKIDVINQGTLPPTDARIGYATPTILYRNRDLFGLPEPAAPFPAPS